mmetsp:Transcript_30440/g.42135  ORF Transcript_30440/g.42135 Transcript_30440/m.42135 type:complete len:112 (-) Transcript_30440:562-897(-)
MDSLSISEVILDKFDDPLFDRLCTIESEAVSISVEKSMEGNVPTGIPMGFHVHAANNPKSTEPTWKKIMTHAQIGKPTTTSDDKFQNGTEKIMHTSAPTTAAKPRRVLQGS